MGQGDTLDNPLSTVSSERALDQWHRAGGSTIYVDMSDHLSFGGGSVFGVSSFAESISFLNSDLAVGSKYHLESKTDVAEQTGDPRITAKFSYYALTAEGPIYSKASAIEKPNSFVWGKTSATINSVVKVLYETTLNTIARPYYSESVLVSAFSLNGEIRSPTEQFDFEPQFWSQASELRNPFPELLKIPGIWILGGGTAFEIEFVGEGEVVDGVYVSIVTYRSTSDPTGQGGSGQDSHVRIITIDPNLSDAALKAQVAVHIFGNDGMPSSYPDAIIRNAAGYEGSNAGYIPPAVSGAAGGPIPVSGGNSDRDPIRFPTVSAQTSASNGPAGATRNWSASGSPTYPTNGGGTTSTYNSGTGYVGDHPGPSKAPTKPSAPAYGGGRPILLDLNGNGVQITDLSKSTQFIDAGDDGFKHRTAWAAAGDGVLFYDADNDNTISQTREYVFTEWDPTAKSDMQALRARFDSNNDGKLTADDAAFEQFRVLVEQGLSVATRNTRASP